jgi:hypothetical protein
MKVSNQQKPQSGKAVSRDELNKWQREDAQKPKTKPSPDPADQESPPAHPDR